MCHRDPVRSTAPYVDFFHLPFIFNPGIRRILMIGLGGGMAARQFLADYPHIELDAVEIDPVVVEVARDYFGLTDDPRLRIHVDDGRHFVGVPGPAYDLVILDAFFSRTVPYDLSTVEFLEELRARLTEGGPRDNKREGAMRGPGSKLFRLIYCTFRGVFPEVYTFARRKDAPGQCQNIALVAPRSRAGLSPAQILYRALYNRSIASLPTAHLFQSYQ